MQTLPHFTIKILIHFISGANTKPFYDQITNKLYLRCRHYLTIQSNYHCTLTQKQTLPNFTIKLLIHLILSATLPHFKSNYHYTLSKVQTLLHFTIKLPIHLVSGANTTSFYNEATNTPCQVQTLPHFTIKLPLPQFKVKRRYIIGAFYIQEYFYQKGDDLSRLN